MEHPHWLAEADILLFSGLGRLEQLHRQHSSLFEGDRPFGDGLLHIQYHHSLPMLGGILRHHSQIHWGANLHTALFLILVCVAGPQLEQAAAPNGLQKLKLVRGSAF